MRVEEPAGVRRAAGPWVMLAAGTLAQGASAVTIHGPAFLIPSLTDSGLTLAQAGAVAAAPMVGVLLTLIAWGLVVDRWGERTTLLTCLGGATLATGLATGLDPGSGPAASSVWQLWLLLAAAGGCAAGCASASGRLVVGWFPPRRRGLAMGVRQMAQPLGVGIGAVSVAVVAERHGVGAALWVPTLATLAGALLVAAVVADPRRPARTEAPAASPYRGDDYLVRVHVASAFLAVPQFLVWTFALVWLVEERGWSAAAAGALVGISQLLGALGRIAAGHLSDRVASRMRPMRWIAVGAAATMLALGATAALDWSLAVGVLLLAAIVTVADNGLAFTGVAERAGPFWSGRALGVQNTAQYLLASAVPPAAGFAIMHVGYAATFALAAALPTLAAPLIPVRQERSLS